MAIATAVFVVGIVAAIATIADIWAEARRSDPKASPPLPLCYPSVLCYPGRYRHERRRSTPQRSASGGEAGH